jgi:hypothetical protein
MLNTSNCKENSLDPDLACVAMLLADNKIKYWLCHGTLLGLMRDGQLIPWDNDIDFACWKNEALRAEIIILMNKNGYRLIHDGDGYDFLTFQGDGERKIDFNFYHDNGEGLAYSNWFVSRNKFAGLLLGLEQRVKELSIGSKGISLIYRKLISTPFIGLVKILKRRNLLYRSAGYSTPVHLLDELRYLQIDNISLSIPKKYESVLQFLYGADWKIPKQNYNWVVDSGSTIVSKK